MKNVISNRKKIKRTFLLLVFAFLTVFILKWGYEVYFRGHDVVIGYDTFSNTASSDRAMSINVATEKVSAKSPKGEQVTIDQKYEKTAVVSSYTQQFSNDNQELRRVIADHMAVIQSENLSGLPGNQRLEMAIGVMPENFDTLVESIRLIGKITSFTVNKVDKTSEYRTLLAEQETLKKTRESYNALKEKGGSIADQLMLEEKILDAEKNLQNLGVNLGLFSTENSFCTVNFTMRESVRQDISLRYVFSCAFSSLLWTVAFFAIVTVFAFAILGVSILVLFLLGKANHLNESAKESAAGTDTEKKIE